MFLMKKYFKVKKSSSSGKTKTIHNIYFDATKYDKSYASYVLLKDYLHSQDEDFLNSFEFRMRKIQFSRDYLTRTLRKTGNLKCSYCPKENLVIEYEGMTVHKSVLATIDHVVPISKGGGVFDEENIVVSCSTCNNSKGSKDLEVFLKNKKSN